mmetsp:Transcript_12618/g.26676  ORF Transcript_12618/g.26676 Transcript_12618/m.26676 type:complete len:288 (+) Transcript_12618:941-1804(+)
MLDHSYQTEEDGQSHHGVDHCRGCDRFLLLFCPTVSIGDTRFLIRASRAFGTDSWDGSARISGANGFENCRKLQRSTDGHSIDVHCRKNHDTTLILGKQLHLEEIVLGISFQSTAVFHALINFGSVDSGMIHRVLYALIVGKIFFGAATKHKFIDVIPPFYTDSIILTIMLPNTHSAQTLLHNISTRNAAIQVIIWVSGAIPSIVGAQIVTIILSLKTLAATPYTIINIHLRSKICPVSQSDSCLLEILLEIHRYDISGSCPKLVLDTIIRRWQTPLHLNPNSVIRL